MKDKSSQQIPPRLLLVEDEVIIAMDMARTLSILGYEVAASVRTAPEALIEARNQRPDLVLMDNKLPGGMDGLSACRIIQESLGIPVIMLTAESPGQFLPKARHSSPKGCLFKPFDNADLKATIDDALGLPEPRTDVTRLQARFDSDLLS